MEHSNVDGGVRGARGVNFQMSTPPVFLTPSRHTDASDLTKRLASGDRSD